MAASLTQSLLTAHAASCSRSMSSSAHLSRAAPLLPARQRAAGSAPSRECAVAPLRVTAGLQMPTSKWWQAKHPPNVVHISSVQQLVDAMASAGDRLVIVDFFAPWCAACRSIYPKVCRIMEERPDVLLLAVNFDENKTLVKALGVKVLPFFMFYRGKHGKLEEFSCNLKRINTIRDAIERHSTPRCYLSDGQDEPVLPEFPAVLPKIAPGSGSLDGVEAPLPLVRQPEVVA